MNFLKKIAAASYALVIVLGEVIFGIIGLFLSLWDVAQNAYYDFFLKDAEGPGSEDEEEKQND